MTSYQKQETQSLLQTNSKHVHHGDKPLSMTHFCESEDFDAHLRRQCYNCNVARLLTMGVLAMFCLTGIFIGTVVVRQSPQDDDSAKNQVEVGPDGTYMVHYDTTDIHPETTSFGALAAVMLPPWYEASLLAIHDHLANRDDDELDPSKVQSCRKVLLMTRDLLDVFAPVFATTNRRGTLKLWKQLRGYYKEGYEKVGYLQDLDHSGVDYSHELLQERIFAVLQWRDEFAKFVHSHNIRFLLRHAVDSSNACHHYFEFKTSHLFWGDEEDGGVTDIHTIPCGTDLAVTSLRDLSSVQLTHAMEYWTTIQTYDSVLDESREEEFHNLRKQLRAYGDTNHLFDDVLLWKNSTTTTNQTATTEATLDRAQHLLGQINDLWTAYHIYVTHDDETHHPQSQQEQLALKIDRAWKEFQEWATTNDLTRVLQQAATSQQQQPVVTTSEQAAAADSDHA